MATRGNTQYTVLSVYSAHTGSGICYNLKKEACLFRALTDIPESTEIGCLPARSLGYVIFALSCPSLSIQQLMLSFRS